MTTSETAPSDDGMYPYYTCGGRGGAWSVAFDQPGKPTVIMSRHRTEEAAMAEAVRRNAEVSA